MSKLEFRDVPLQGVLKELEERLARDGLELRLPLHRLSEGYRGEQVTPNVDLSLRDVDLLEALLCIAFQTGTRFMLEGNVAAFAEDGAYFCGGESCFLNTPSDFLKRMGVPFEKDVNGAALDSRETPLHQALAKLLGVCQTPGSRVSYYGKSHRLVVYGSAHDTALASEFMDLIDGQVLGKANVLDLADSTVRGLNDLQRRASAARNHRRALGSLVLPRMDLAGESLPGAIRRLEKDIRRVDEAHEIGVFVLCPKPWKADRIPYGNGPTEEMEPMIGRSALHILDELCCRFEVRYVVTSKAVLIGNHCPSGTMGSWTRAFHPIPTDSEFSSLPSVWSSVVLSPRERILMSHGVFFRSRQIRVEETDPWADVLGEYDCPGRGPGTPDRVTYCRPIRSLLVSGSPKFLHDVEQALADCCLPPENK